MTVKTYRFYVKPHQEQWGIFDRERSNALVEVCSARDAARAKAKQMNEEREDADQSG